MDIAIYLFLKMVLLQIKKFIIKRKTENYDSPVFWNSLIAMRYQLENLHLRIELKVSSTTGCGLP